MKIAFGMIVFEGDYVLRQCLEQVYPYASQILIAEGPVSYWQSKGRTTSLDKTNDIIDNFPDPEGKIKIVHSQYREKDDQCKAYMKYINDDIDYIWNLDSDEVYKSEDIEKIIKILEEEKPTSVGVRSCTFYGGFERYLTGFELNKDNFLRIFRYMPGATWATHRPPTINYPASIEKKHIDSETLFAKTGAQMYHYSYVFPYQVFKKISYYKDFLTRNLCIDNYFTNIYLPWVVGDHMDKYYVETQYRGVHEYQPESRGDCYTEEFTGTHPQSIQRSIDELKQIFDDQLINIVKQVRG